MNYTVSRTAATSRKSPALSEVPLPSGAGIGSFAILYVTLQRIENLISGTAAPPCRDRCKTKSARWSQTEYVT